MTTLGIDIGSRNVKMALQTDDGPIKFFAIPTPLFYRDYFTRVDHCLKLNTEALQLPPVDDIVATGYGRNNIGLEKVQVISEIQAHTLGSARLMKKQQFLLLDLGGQDTKVILVQDGHVEDFQINDKCAAGSGRYLENMAEVLGVSLETLFKHFLDPADLSTTCATYAESELIGKVADGIPIEQLCAGVNHSTFLRLRPMLEHWPHKHIVFVGGGAKNNAVIHYLESAGYQVEVPEKPEFTGALGCLELIRQTS